MAPKEAFKVHSFSKHLEDTKKGLSAEAQFNRRPAHSKAVKKEPGNADASIFGNNDSDDESSGGGSGSDSSDDGTSFINKLNGLSGSAAGKRRNKSDDEVADSDAERKATAAKVKPGKKAVAPKVDSTSDSSSDAESDESDKEVTKTNGVAPTKKAASSTSSGSESESGSGSESDESSDESSSEGESEGESENDEEVKSKTAPQLKAQVATNGKSTKKAASSSSEEESSSEESEDEDDKVVKSSAKESEPTTSDTSSEGESDSDEQMADESMHIADRDNDKQLAVPKFISPDFVLRKGDDGANGQDVAKICNQANLQGKQFWYFTVPSNVPISVVQNMEIPMDQSQRGERLFSHNGEDYGMSFDTMMPKSNIQILIPSTDGSQYRSGKSFASPLNEIF